MGKIVAIGGGDNGQVKSRFETGMFDNEIIRLTNKENPRYLFLGFANKDADEYYEVMSGIYSADGCLTDHLTIDDIKDKSVAAAKINASDIIYVGSGDTHRLMRLLRRYEIDELLIKAYEDDKVMCGIGSGAICWCKYGSSNYKGGGEFTRVSGLGILPVLYCPYAISEPARSYNLSEMMRITYRIPAIAADRAAIEVIGEKFRIIYLAANSKAEKCFWRNGTYYTEDIKSTDFRPLENLYTK